MTPDEQTAIARKRAKMNAAVIGQEAALQRAMSNTDTHLRAAQVHELTGVKLRTGALSVEDIRSTIDSVQARKARRIISEAKAQRR